MNISVPNDERRRERSGALMGSGRRSSLVLRHSPLHAAFTLLEVIIACAIFFLVGFAILELVASSLKSARKLQSREPDPGIVPHALSLSNKWEEGTFSGTFEDIAPGMYPGYRFEGEAREIGSNGLWHADLMVYSDRDTKRGPSVISWSFWCPTCPPGSITKGQQ